MHTGVQSGGMDLYAGNGKKYDNITCKKSNQLSKFSLLEKIRM
jgi:hypothetical protein